MYAVKDDMHRVFECTNKDELLKEVQSLRFSKNTVFRVVIDSYPEGVKKKEYSSKAKNMLQKCFEEVEKGDKVTDNDFLNAVDEIHQVTASHD